MTFGEMMWAGFFVLVFALWQILQSTSIRNLCDRIDALEKLVALTRTTEARPGIPGQAYTRAE